MKKGTNIFRKCAYCPHHGAKQEKCCCRKLKSKGSKQNQKRTRNHSAWLKNQSSIEIVPQQRTQFMLSNHSRGQLADSNQSRLSSIDIPTLLAENSYLKSENINLKQDVLSISHIISNENNMRQSNLMPKPNNVTNCQTSAYTLSDQSTICDKLYHSNKKLQEAVFKIDSLSRENKELHENLVNAERILERQAIQKAELAENNQILKKQCRKLQNKLHKQSRYEQTEISEMESSQKLLKEKYLKLKQTTHVMEQEINRLKQRISKHELEDRLCVANLDETSQNLSPEWIAETSNKLNYISEKIDQGHLHSQHQTQRHVKTFESTQQKNTLNTNEAQIHDLPFAEMFRTIKQELILAINTVNMNVRKFCSSFDSIGDASVENSNVTNLIRRLCEGFMESCMSFNFAFEKEIHRKVSSLQKRLDYVLGRLENYVLEVKNRELRKRSTSRSVSRISQSVSASKSQRNFASKTVSVSGSYLTRGKENHISASNFENKTEVISNF